MSNRQTLINQILYWSYRYQLRDIPFEWNGEPFDPKNPLDYKFIEEQAHTHILQAILTKYQEKREIFNQTPDDMVYRQKRWVAMREAIGRARGSNSPANFPPEQHLKTSQ